MDRRQFDIKVLPLHGAMYRLAFFILKDSEAAADALQDAMLRLWQRRDALDSVTNLPAYALSTVRNISVSLSSRRSDSLDDAATATLLSRQSVEDDYLSAEQLSMVLEAIENLSHSQRTALKLSALQGYSNSEISNATGLSEMNVRTLLSRSRRKLRSLFPNN